MRMSINSRIVISTLFIVAWLFSASSVQAQDNSSNLRRLSAEFQNSTSLGGFGETETNAAAGRWSHGPVIDNQDIDTRKTIQAL